MSEMLLFVRLILMTVTLGIISVPPRITHLPAKFCWGDAGDWADWADLGDWADLVDWADALDENASRKSRLAVFFISMSIRSG